MMMWPEAMPSMAIERATDLTAILTDQENAVRKRAVKANNKTGTNGLVPTFGD
jgi:hypothetical protein